MQRATSCTQRTLDVDSRQRALGHRDLSRAGQLREQLAEVRVMAGDDRSGGIARVAQELFEGGQVEGSREAVVGRISDAEMARHDLRGLRGPQLRRADDRVRLEPDPGQERAQPLGLLLALV